nr:reverse transcriptase domain-containing protein [Tanacetum cinerariifolium]
MMADQRIMAQLLQAPTEGYEDAIVVPAITADNFELKHGLLTLVQNKQFFGHDKEDPHAHIRYFNKITSTLKFPNVSNTSIKLMLFPFSLEGAAWIWLEKEPPRLIFTWDDLVLKFINQFFPPSKTTNLLNEITNFQQRFDESFSEAWGRFKDLLKACPHHGFLELYQLDTFYNALNSKDQDSLNSPAGGNFLDKMPCKCLAIIESKSKVRYPRNKPVVAKVSMNTSTSGISPDVVELKDMVKALLLDKKSQNQAPTTMKAVKESCVTCGGAHSYRNCPATDGNVYRDNIQEFVSQASAVNYNQGNTSYRPPMMSNQIRPPGFPPFQTIRMFNSIKGTIKTPPAYKAPVYHAPAPQTQGVSKEDFSAYVKANDAVMRNMQTQGQKMQNQLTNLTELLTKFVNSNSASTSSSGTLPSNTIANPRSDLTAITTRSVNSPTIEPVVSPVSALRPNQRPSIPYSSRLQDQKLRDKANDQREKFFQIFKDLNFNISFADALILMPKFGPSIKSLLTNKDKLCELAKTLLNEHCSAILLKKLPEKLGDPGKFLIPCNFPEKAECLALADLGASINLMPLSVWNKLSLPDLSPTCMNLELADHSISHPVGVAEDVYVKVGTFHFLTDFVVVDFDADPRVSLILRRSFLKTERALIDVFEADQSYLDSEGDILLLEAFLNDDPSLPPPNQENYLPEVRKELKIYEAKSDKSSSDEPSKVELKYLHPHLEYVFLEGDDKLPVITAKDLSIEEKIALITVLKSHKRAIAWKLSDINGNQYYCFLDGFSDYFQIPIDLKDQEKTTFTCPYGTFAYRRMSFGLCNAPGTFQRCRMVIFHDMIKKTMEVFMDDFLIFGNFFQSCLSHLENTLKRCEDTNLCLNWEKSHFMVKECIVLGHKISKERIEVDKAKVDVITKLPHPTTVKGIRSFLGHAGFYRSDWDMPFELMCNASDFAIGAFLGQRQDKHFRPIHYASKTMTEAESNYTTIEKEMLAVVYAFEKSRSYLIMNKSIVYTDHSALKYLFAKKDSKARLLRWVLLVTPLFLPYSSES